MEWENKTYNTSTYKMAYKFFDKQLKCKFVVISFNTLIKIIIQYFIKYKNMIDKCNKITQLNYLKYLLTI